MCFYIQIGLKNAYTHTHFYMPIKIVNVKNVFLCMLKAGGAVAQSVESAIPGEEVSGLIPALAALSLLVGSVSV